MKGCACRWTAVLFLSQLGLLSAGAQDQASAAGHHQQGMALYRAHDPGGAIRELRQAVELDAHYAEAWTDLGVIERQRGDLKDAVDSFRKAIAEKPEFAGALYNLALALEASHDVNGAMEQTRRVLALAPRQREITLCGLYVDALH